MATILVSLRGSHVNMRHSADTVCGCPYRARLVPQDMQQ